MIEDPETYLDVRYAELALVCERAECRVPYHTKNSNRPSPAVMRELVIKLPPRCIPEEVVMIRAKHLATHTMEVADGVAQ